MVKILTPLIVVIMVGAPLILSLFGASYSAEGAMLLRLLALSALPNAVVVVYISLSRVQNRVRGIIFVQGALCTIALGFGYALLGPLGVTGAGIAWLVGQTVVAAALLLGDLRPILRHGGNESASGPVLHAPSE
jgi:O-antigen/teichoic acid export membrane protein